MPITADCHLHSSFSGDSHTPMEEMIQRGIDLGLTTMCFTEHNDFAYPDSPDGPGDIFLLNTDQYLYELLKLRHKYGDRIRILFGVELGLQPEVFRENAVFARAHEYDFVIASSHVCNGRDPYYPSFYEGRSDAQAYREYFESELANIRQFDNFDVYGHLDYVVRYGKTRDTEYSYEKYRDIFDEILKTLIDKEKGIEVNTGGLKKGMRDLHPCMGVLKRYRELGGEVVTVGSDSHDTGHIADYFDRARDVLLECGFRYITVFEKRTPEFIRL